MRSKKMLENAAVSLVPVGLLALFYILYLGLFVDTTQALRPEDTFLGFYGDIFRYLLG